MIDPPLRVRDYLLSNKRNHYHVVTTPSINLMVNKMQWHEAKVRSATAHAPIDALPAND